MAKRIPDLVIENAEIIFKNFSGKESRFNPAGRRNFCVFVDESAKDLEADGWNVKYTKPRDDESVGRPYISVAINYTNNPPKIFLITKNNKTLLDEDSVGSLDWADILNVDLIVNPYSWEVNGKSGVKAYVKTMYVTIQEDQFEGKYNFDKNEYDDDVPF